MNETFGWIGSDPKIQEINQYYARRGGTRTASIRNFANVGSFSKHIQKATAQNTLRQQKEISENENQQDTSSRSVAENGNACCENCRLTSQLALQLMSRNLYLQNGMGYSSLGTGSFGSLSSWQNMLNALGSGSLA